MGFAAALGVLASTWLALGLAHLAAPGRASGPLGPALLASGDLLTIAAMAVFTALRFALAGI